MKILLMILVFNSCSKKINQQEQDRGINYPITKGIDDIFDKMAHGNLLAFQNSVKDKSKDSSFKFEKQDISLIIYAIQKLNNNDTLEKMINFLINDTNIIKDTKELDFLLEKYYLFSEKNRRIESEKPVEYPDWLWAIEIPALILTPFFPLLLPVSVTGFVGLAIMDGIEFYDEYNYKDYYHYSDHKRHLTNEKNFFKNIIKTLVKKYPMLLTDPSYKKVEFPPAHLAANNSDNNMVEFFFNQNKDTISFKNRFDNTPLDIASKELNVSTVIRLLKLGAEFRIEHFIDKIKHFKNSIVHNIFEKHKNIKNDKSYENDKVYYFLRKLIMKDLRESNKKANKSDIKKSSYNVLEKLFDGKSKISNNFNNQVIKISIKDIDSSYKLEKTVSEITDMIFQIELDLNKLDFNIIDWSKY